MIYFHSAASVKLALILMALLAATVANASLLDCTHSSGVECVPKEAVVDTGHESVQDGLPVTPINIALTSFRVDQTRGASAIPESAPLLVLFGALLAVVLVRAKSHNSK
ncbi:MAG: hypothetical protein Q7T48_15360 [Cellvibrio sp.]|uniref:hypothetical protein n=1 Tax=Cellvibrio sp. TaxID=1965322 RepID=UPI00271D0C0A|nr:hypothetical protein [Cellvibrio sp.]